MATKADSNTKQRRRASIGNKISFSGMLLMCAAFFLPQVEGCGETIIPSKIMFSGGDFDEICFYAKFFWPFFCASALAVIYCLKWIMKSERGRKAIIVVGCIICILALAFGSFLMLRLSGGSFQMSGDDGLRNGDECRNNWRWSIAAAIAYMATILALGLSANVPYTEKLPLCVFLFGLCSVVYFATFGMTPDEAYYGLWVSLASSVLITVGALWETIWQQPVKLTAALDLAHRPQHLNFDGK